MGRKFVITPEDLERVRAALVNSPAPEPKTLSKAQAIGGLRRELERMQRRGDSFAAMAEALTRAGIPISAGVLRAYWHQTRDAGARSALHARNPGATSPAAGPKSATKRPRKTSGVGTATSAATTAQSDGEPGRSAARKSAASVAPVPGDAGVSPPAAAESTSVATEATQARKSQFKVREDSDKL
jgi:hypothetical protein